MMQTKMFCDICKNEIPSSKEPISINLGYLDKFTPDPFYRNAHVRTHYNYQHVCDDCRLKLIDAVEKIRKGEYLPGIPVE